MRNRFVVVLVLAFPLGAFAGPVATGELDYRLSWNGIPAAEATINVLRDGEDVSNPTYRVEATARTNWVVDLLWSLRAYAGSRFDASQPKSLWFRFDRYVNDERSVTDIAFSSFPPGATGTLRRRDQTKVMSVDDPDVLDPITAIFHAISRPVSLGDKLEYELFTGESRYRVELDIEGEETIEAAGGRYPAWRVNPRVWKVGKGLEPRLRHATVWVSREPVRALLRIRSEVFIGAVYCDLVHLPEQTPPNAVTRATGRRPDDDVAALTRPELQPPAGGDPPL